MDCSALFNCIPGHFSRPRHQSTIAEKQCSVINDQPVQSAEDAAAQFIDILRTSAKGGKGLERRLKNVVSVNSWTEELAKYILQGVEALVQHRETVGQFVREAMDKSTDSAESIFNIAKDHPILVTIVAIGVLVIIAPWVLEALGFGELGPVADTFASWWQARYAGYVPEGSLFSFFQRLDPGRIRHLEDTRVDIKISLPDDHLVMRDGRLLLEGPAPDPETIDLWL